MEKQRDKKTQIKIIGAGLAGSEAALVLARTNPQLNIELIEMRPTTKTPVHKTENCAELVCSNSFKSMKPTSAAGMLKQELSMLASPVFATALETYVDAGGALAVDREKFSESITHQIESAPNIDFQRREVLDLVKESKDCKALIIATGPLTTDTLSKQIIDLTGQDKLAFYDAAAPIVMADSIDMDKVFVQDRYGKGADDFRQSHAQPNENSEKKGDYLNAPFIKDEYETFIDELLNAKLTILHDFESKDLFQACQPIEQVARTGVDSPRFGALKPVGLIDPRTGKRPWAVVQLRAENANKTAYNLVGFQTNLTFSEQKRVFRMIPSLEHAEFARYGVMHRNTFINAPTLLDENLQLRACDNECPIYFAGQICGTEGYLEAVRSGHHVALAVLSGLNNSEKKSTNTKTTTQFDVGDNLPATTAFGSLLKYATNPETKHYQPMHVNFGIIEPLSEKVRNKQARYAKYAERGTCDFEKYLGGLCYAGLIEKTVLQQGKKCMAKLEEVWDATQR